MVLGKICEVCEEFFPAELGSFNNCCEKPECQRRLRMHVTHIKQTRNIEAKYFDVFDTAFPTPKSWYKFERVCRVCGSRLLKKDGSYASNRRQCKKHANDPIYMNYTWSVIRDRILFNNFKRFENEIKEAAIKQATSPVGYSKGIAQRIWERYNYCEECGKIAPCEVHHKVPVHTLTNENLLLIWDPQNLICLCKDCHGKQDHQLKHAAISKPEKFTNFVKLDLFLKG